MTMKTKRNIAIGGGTVFCAALAVLIATRFAPEDMPITTSNSEPTSSVEVNVQISTLKPSESKPTDNKPTEKPDTDIPDNTSSTVQITSDPDKEAEDFISGGGIEVRQDFPEPEKKTESTPTTDNTQTSKPTQNTDTSQTAPTEPPKIKDENALTDPTKEPTYSSEQIEITPPDSSTNPNINPAMHGQRKDGKIFINGFGWVVDHGGGGKGEYDSEMYENGNKIGYFG